MTSRRNLTERIIRAAEYHGTGRAPCFLWDGRVPGLTLRIHPGGVKVWVLDYRYHGRRHRISLGRYGAVTLAAAREAADRPRIPTSQPFSPLRDNTGRARLR